MSRHLHVDPVSGVSGDMMLGALFDLGAPIDDVRADLAQLDLPGWELETDRVTRHGITGTLATVHTADQTEHRHAAELIHIIASAGLRPTVTATACAVIQRIAVVEAEIHGVPLDEVHFHEIGALDTIIDVVGVCSALHHLDVASATCGPLPTGSGTVMTAHGELPVPAPATLALLAGTGIRWRFTDDPMELVTPTGAALVAQLARPALGVEIDVATVGYGFGSSTKLDRANYCRLMLSSAQPETIVRLGTTIDDQTPETLAVALEECRTAGALDAWTTPVIMKKGRLGSDVTVLCRTADEARLVDLLFDHTTTLGIRRATVDRHVAERVEQVVDVDGHQIRIKLRHRNGHALGAKPDPDDCTAAAHALGVSVDDVRRRALVALTS